MSAPYRELMNVIGPDGKIVTRAVDHMERIEGAWTEVPEIRDSECIMWLNSAQGIIPRIFTRTRTTR
jgi:hypothetical protein